MPIAGSVKSRWGRMTGRVLARRRRRCAPAKLDAGLAQLDLLVATDLAQWESRPREFGHFRDTLRTDDKRVRAAPRRSSWRAPGNYVP
jgi:hypothetical protein